MFAAQKVMSKTSPAILTQRFDAATKSPYVGLTGTDRQLVVTDGYFSYEGARSTVSRSFFPSEAVHFEFVLSQTLEGVQLGFARGSVSMALNSASGPSGAVLFLSNAASGQIRRDGSVVTNTGVTGCDSGDRFLVCLRTGGNLEVYKNGSYIGAGSSSGMAGSGDIYAFVTISGGSAGVAGTVNFGHTSFTQSPGGGSVAWG